MKRTSKNTTKLPDSDQAIYDALRVEADKKRAQLWCHDAIRDYRTLIAWDLSQRDERNVAISLMKIISCYIHIASYDEAIKTSMEALRYARKLKNLRAIGGVYGAIANIYRIQGLFEVAAKYAIKTLHIFEKLGIEEQIGIAHINLSAIYIERRKMQLAEPHLLVALQIFQKNNLVIQEVNATIDYSKVLSSRFEYDVALQTLNRAITLAHSTTNEYYEALGLNSRGMLHRMVAQVDLAKSDLLRAVDIFRLSGNKRFVGIALNHLGILLNEVGEVVQAYASLSESMLILDEIRAFQPYVMALYAYTQMIQYRGKQETALQQYQTMIEICRAHNLRDEEFIMRGWLGVLQAEMGNQHAAELIFRDSIEPILKTSHEEKRVGLLIGISICYSIWNDDVQAKTIFDLARKDFSKQPKQTTNLELLLAMLFLRIASDANVKSKPHNLTSKFSSGRGKSLASSYNQLVSGIEARQLCRESSIGYYFLIARAKLLRLGIEEGLLGLPANWNSGAIHND